MTDVSTTPITQMIFFNQGMLLLGSNHFLIYLTNSDSHRRVDRQHPLMTSNYHDIQFAFTRGSLFSIRIKEIVTLDINKSTFLD